MIRTKLFFLWIGCCSVISTSVLSGCSTVNSDVYTQGALQSAYRSSLRPESYDTPSDLKLYISPFVDLRTEKEDTGNLWKCAVPVLSMQARWDKPDWLDWDPMQYAGYKPFAQDLTEVFTGSLKKTGLLKSVCTDQTERCDLILKGEIDELKLSLYPHFYGTSYFVGQFMGLLGIKMGDWDVQQTISLRIEDPITGKVIWRKRYKTDDQGALAMYYGRNPIAYGYPADQLIAPVLKTFRADLRTFLKTNKSRLLAQKSVQTGRPADFRASSSLPPRKIFGDKYALLIGIDQYLDADIAPLTYAEKDIQVLKDVLVSSSGYQDKNVFVMRSNDPNIKNRPTRNNVLLTLKWLSTNLRPEDSLLFMYCGHGDSVNGDNYLIPMDGQKALLEDTAIRFSRVFEWLDRCPAGSQIVCLDACHSGGLARNQRGSRGMQAVATSMGKELEKYSASGRAVLTSCSRDEISYEDNDLQHGVFSYYLIEALSSAQADSNGDKAVTVYELGHYVRSHVTAWCKNQRKIPTQTPRLRFNDLSGEITLLDFK